MFPYGVCVKTSWAGEGPQSLSPLDVNRKTKGSFTLTPFPPRHSLHGLSGLCRRTHRMRRKRTGEHGPARGSGGRPSWEELRHSRR